MKVLQLSALFGVAASAANPLIARNVVRSEPGATTESVVLVTSTFTVTKCATNAVNCPASDVVISTSTTVVSTTTTICSTTSAPAEVQPPVVGVTSVVDVTSKLPLGPGPVIASSIDASLVASSGYNKPSGSAVLSSRSPEESNKTSVSLSSASSVSTSTLPKPSDSIISVSLIPGSSVESSISIIPPTPTVIVSSSDAPGLSSTLSNSPSSNASGSVPASSTPHFTVTDAIPSSITSSPSGYAPNLPNTNTGAVSTSFPVLPPSLSSALAASSSSAALASSSAHASSSALALSSGGYGSPPSSLTTVPASTTEAPISSTTPASPVSETRPIESSTGSVKPSVPIESESAIDSTTKVTSYLTQTKTSFITVPPASSGSSSDTATDATRTSRPSSISAIPSGSGYPYPSGSGNGTVISPKPTYSEVPVNIGQIVSAGKSSLAAIIVALVFANFA